MPAYRACDVLSETIDAAIRMIQGTRHLKAVELWEELIFADSFDRFAARLDLDVPGHPVN
jgi:hypothetical protein